MPLKIEPGEVVAPDIAPKTTELAGGQTPPDKPVAKPASDAKKKPDTAGINQFMKMQIGDRYEEIDPPAKPKAKEDDDKGRERKPDGTFVKAEKPDKTKDEPAPKPKAAPATKFKPKAQPAAEPLTAEQIAAAAAEGATRALTAGKAKQQADEDKASEPKLSAQDNRKVEILSRMEELNPEKYKGIAAKYTNSISALEQYAKKWETDHPGQEFDESSVEHEDFFKTNDVDWEDMDFTEALTDIRAEKRMNEATQKTDKRLEELDRAERLRSKQSEIASEQNTAAIHFWQQLGDDVADMVKPDGSLNLEKVEQLKVSDPEGLALRITAGQALDAEVAEIFKLFNGLVENDPSGNVIHRNINQFAAAKEAELSSKPTQEKFNAEGKEFLPASKYWDKRISAAERVNYWTFSARDLAFLRAKELSDVTRKRLELNEERHRAWAKSRGLQIDEPSAKPDSPSAGGESRMAALDTPAPKNSGGVHSDFVRKQIGH